MSRQTINRRLCKNNRPLTTTTLLSLSLSSPSSSAAATAAAAVALPLEDEESQEEPTSLSLSLSSNLPASDQTLSPEFYKSVYRDLQQQQQDNDNDKDKDKEDTNDENDSIIIKTPWDIGGGGGGRSNTTTTTTSNNNYNYCRPQPAIERAYKENKMYGHILDAGCGLGENCMYLAQQPPKYYGKNIDSITGFDFSKESIELARATELEIEIKMNNEEQQQHDQDQSSSSSSSPSIFYTKPNFIAASCTDIADRHDHQELFSAIKNSNSNSTNSNNDNDNNNRNYYFDVVIDSGLLHCLNDDDAIQYVNQISKLIKPDTGRFYIGCFSTKNTDPWDNPRRLNEEYIYQLFNHNHNNNNDSTDNIINPLWEVETIRDTWWARPPSRGSSTGGAFSLALWIEVRRTSTSTGNSTVTS